MKKDQKGFTAVEAVIVLVVVALLAAVGWYVYRANHKKKEDNKTTTSQQTNTNSNETANSKQTPAAEKKYFVIKEWGVKAEYEGSYKLTYTISGNGAGFTSEELVAQDPACKPTYGGSIARYAPNDQAFPSGGGPTAEEQAKTDSNFVKVGNYYYRFIHTQSGCGSSDAAVDKNQALQQQVNDAVKGLVPKLIAE